MSVESWEERTVEVLALPPAVDEELLCLYFENRRRSGGGPLVSVEKKGDRVVLVFEEAEAAARVLSKRPHVLHNVELSLRRPASKDPRRLLLRGVNPTTSIEMIELYVENMMDVTDYTLHPSPGRDLILVHLSRPLSKDFPKLSARISKRTLDGAAVTLEQVVQTDSVLVENLHPGTTSDLLLLYFENKGSHTVKEVSMLSEGTAKVSFLNFDSMDRVVELQHRLDGTALVVRPYFDFLQPAQGLPPPDSGAGGQGEVERDLEDVSDMYSDPPAADGLRSSPETTTAPPAAPEAAEELMEAQTEEEEEEVLSEHIDVADRAKLALFERSALKQDAEKAHPDLTIRITEDGVDVAGIDRQTLQQIKDSISDCFAEMAQSHVTLEPGEAAFLAREEVRERLQEALTRTGSAALYGVSDRAAVVTSLSQGSADQAWSFLQAQLSHFSVPVGKECEGLFHCREWSDFLEALRFSSVTTSGREGSLEVLTLRGMESEEQTAIQDFLSTPIERQTLISMEPGMLKYLQIHCHQLLAEMDQVSIFPVEAEEVCGLNIHGHAVACQMAEEVLRGVISSICTRTITVNAPGVSRFLCEEDCKSILREMQKKFQVYIKLKVEPWEPLPHQDIFETAQTLMSRTNFHKKSDSTGRGLIEDAKRIVSAIDGGPEEGASASDLRMDDLDDLDLYTAEEPAGLSDSQDSDVIFVDASQPSNNGAPGLLSDLEEEAQLSLAIQYSMEASQWTLADEEEQLQKALELSKSMIQQGASPNGADKAGKKGGAVSLQEAIKGANTLQLFVFAGYSCDLIRVDIAFGKKVSQRQVEEKVEHRAVKNMSDYHRMCLEMIKRKHGVEVQVQGTIVSVSGFQEFVPGALSDVKLLLDKLSKCATDQEILRDIQWVYRDPDETAYPPDATVFIENCWRMKLRAVDLLLDGRLHTINFEKMQEYSEASGKSVKVSRKLVNLGDLGDIPEAEISQLSNLPDATKIDEMSDEFQMVVKSFYETIHEFHSKIRIIQVEKLENRLLFNQYKLKKASILQRAALPEVEQTLYHGTNEASVKEICVHGFNRSFCGKNATVYGKGVYFAVNSSLSLRSQYSPPNADGYKYVFVSKVLTGDYTLGNQSMKTAPLKETGDIPLRYDSVTDNVTKPSMFVIFNDTQAFPEYLITCQKIY